MGWRVGKCLLLPAEAQRRPLSPRQSYCLQRRSAGHFRPGRATACYCLHSSILALADLLPATALKSAPPAPLSPAGLLTATDCYCLQSSTTGTTTRSGPQNAGVSILAELGGTTALRGNSDLRVMGGGAAALQPSMSK